MKIGFDIGGTKIEVCVLNHQGKKVFAHRQSTPNDYEAFLELLESLAVLAEKTLECRFNSVGLGLPGAVCPKTGLIKNANILFLNGNNLQADLQARLKRPVSLANDANCLVLSEAIDGAASDGRVVFGAILGTGCGGGIVVDKRLLVGANAITGEWGHNPLPGFDPAQDGEARPCYCGRVNCIEQFISGTGFELSYQALSGKSIKAKEIMTLLEAGDELAVKCYRQLVAQMARSFASIVNVLDPDVIVVGGGLSNVTSLYQDVPKAMKPYVFSSPFEVKLMPAKFGDSSGIRGAAWLNDFASSIN